MGNILAFGLGLGVGWIVFKKKRVTISGHRRFGAHRRRRRLGR